MSWLEKLLPPKIQPTDPAGRRAVPEGLWIKCPACETVLYKTDLEQNLNVCPKCDHHHRIGARTRLDAFLDPEGRWEIGQEVLPVDALKFKDSKKYPARLKAALESTGETDARRDVTQTFAAPACFSRASRRLRHCADCRKRERHQSDCQTNHIAFHSCFSFFKSK